MLLPILARYGGDVGAREAVVRVLAAHARIRGLIMQLGDETMRREVRADTVNELADQLEAHVVLEEGEVYPLLERVLPREALEEIPKRLPKAVASRTW